MKLIAVCMQVTQQLPNNEVTPQDFKAAMGNSSASKGLGTHPKPETIIQVNDWSGPHDKENPCNWTYARKIYHTAVPSAFAFVV